MTNAFPISLSQRTHSPAPPSSGTGSPCPTCPPLFPAGLNETTTTTKHTRKPKTAEPQANSQLSGREVEDGAAGEQTACSGTTSGWSLDALEIAVHRAALQTFCPWVNTASRRATAGARAAAAWGGRGLGKPPTPERRPRYQISSVGAAPLHDASCSPC